MNEDTRWIQRFSNFKKALKNLAEAVVLSNERELTKLEKQGLIQAFEIVYELAWNTIKDYYQAQVDVDVQGSRDAFRLAFKRGLIEDGEVFMKTIKSRQLTSHSYNEEVANAIYSDIVNKYFPAYNKLKLRLEKEKD